jgi:uncharacterized protein (DUF58 family)
VSGRARRLRAGFDRWNHILIPKTKAERDRFRSSRVSKVMRPLVAIYMAFTDEGRFAFVVALVVAGFGVDVRRTDVHVLWSVLGAVILASLVVSRAFRLQGVRIDVAAPARVTVGEPMTFTLVCKSDAARSHFGLRVRGPFLPWDGRWVTPRPTVPEVAPKSTSRAEVQASFSQRGEHHLDPFHASALVPLGLAVGPAIETPGCRFLVVPRIANVVRLTTPIGRRHQPGGIALASKTGESMDLLGVRPYRPGDPARDLHARSWARTGQPVVREFQEEYFSRVGVVVDTDRTVTDPQRFEAALSLAAGVVARLSRGEALIDLLVVGDSVHSLTIGRSLGFLDQALDLLACVEAGAAPTMEALWEKLSPHLPRLSCVVVVALAWDPARRALVDRIRGLGVGCVTILVTEPELEGAGSRGEDRRRDLKVVAMDAILRGEALSL